VLINAPATAQITIARIFLAVSCHLGYVPQEEEDKRRKKSALNRMATRMQKPIHTLLVSVRESLLMDAG